MAQHPMTLAERLLDLTRPFGAEEVRSAHRIRILRWHPDRNPGNADEALRRSQQINAARDELLALLQRLDGVLDPIPAPPPPAQPVFEDFRDRHGALWVRRVFRHRPDLPEGWGWATTGLHTGWIWTKLPGNPAILATQVIEWLDVRAAAG